MAYGRLEVYYPDGAFRTFLLTEPNVSIGRSAGNMIAFDVEGISRYHVSVTYADGKTHITDLESANGTFVDGERLKPNEPAPLLGGDEIQIGEVRMIFQSFDESPTRPVVPVEDTTRRMEVETGLFTVDLFEPEQAVSPSAYISAQISISNTGTQTERYTVEVGGLPSEWVRIDRRELEIDPGKGGDVLINFKPRRRPDSTPGDYAVTVTVRARSTAAAVISNFTLRVLPYGGFGMAVEQRYLRMNEPLRLHLHNQGSAPLPLSIIPRDLANGVQVTLNPPRLTLAPGQRGLVTGQIRPKQVRLFGDPIRHPVDLIVRSGDAAAFTAPTRLYVTEKPPLPGYARFVLAGGALALVGLILVGLLILLRPPGDPAVQALTLSADRVQQGEPLRLSWQAENAESVEVYANGVLIGTFPASQTSADLPTDSLSGAVAVEVRARRGESVGTATTAFTVDPGFTVASFTVDPPTVTRYVTQTLTIAWSVPGATSVQLTGGFATSPLTGTQPETGAVTITGIWEAPLPMTLNLTAQNGAGELIQSMLTIETIPVTCTASIGDVALYSAPDSRGQILATVPRDSQVEITGRDVDTRWLRVAVTGGANGWGRVESFTCPDPAILPNLLLVPDIATAQPEPAITASPAAPTAAGLGTPTGAPGVLSAPNVQSAPAAPLGGAPTPTATITVGG
ncbi:MAG: FHA domain-containing protein [bacterium]|nr:FHA domain-containing protein [bacterium]